MIFKSLRVKSLKQLAVENPSVSLPLARFINKRPIVVQNKIGHYLAHVLAPAYVYHTSNPKTKLALSQTFKDLFEGGGI